MNYAIFLSFSSARKTECQENVQVDGHSTRRYESYLITHTKIGIFHGRIEIGLIIVVQHFYVKTKKR